MRERKGASEPNQPLANIQAAASAVRRQDSATAGTFRVASAVRNPAEGRIPSPCSETGATNRKHARKSCSRLDITSGCLTSSRPGGHGCGRQRALSQVTSSTRVGKEISWIPAAFASPAYFAADLTNGVGNTGSQAWKVPYEGTPRVPEPATLGLTSAGLLALFAMRKLRRLE
jgi:hypothetical protein